MAEEKTKKSVTKKEKQKAPAKQVKSSTEKAKAKAVAKPKAKTAAKSAAKSAAKPSGLDLQTQFHKEIRPRLQKDLGLKNIFSVPQVTKVKINVGIGSFMEGKKDHKEVVENIKLISGQQPIVTKARKAISNFKVREDDPVGVTATLRGKRMYDFINKLVNVVLPRVRDFRGISKKSFDRRGNYSLGIKEHTVFPEINPEDIVRIHGLQVTVTTTAKTDNEGYELLKSLGFPFKEARLETTKPAEKS